MKELSVVKLVFILNRFFKFLFEGCQRWRTSYISREGVGKPSILIKTGNC